MLVHLKLALSQGVRHRITPTEADFDECILIHPAHGGGCIAKPGLLSESTSERMTHPTNKEIPEYTPSHDVKEAGLAAPFAIGCGAADAEYTWHDLTASSPLTASYTISWFLRVVSVPRDLQETSSVSYLRARNVIWTAATCRKAGVKPNTLAKVPLLGGKQTHDHA